MISNLFLTGFMGSGKSTVGPLVAARLGWSFIDLDTWIEDQIQMPLSELVRLQGEKQLRFLESSSLSELSHRSNLVLSLGGGTLLQEKNRSALRQKGLLIYLRATVLTLSIRLKQNSQIRPLLIGHTGESMTVRIQELMKQRQEGYETAQVVIDVDHLQVQEVVEKILNYTM